MKPETAPLIYSFIIRFVVDESPQQEGSPAAYHGAIRHIQTAEEINFNAWSEAVAFMRRFIPIESLNDHSNS